MRDDPHADDTFAAFFEEAEPRLRAALVAHYGPEVGREAAADALAYAWESWDRVQSMDNPIGYLYRVGQSRARTFRRPVVLFPEVTGDDRPEWEPGLPVALAGLSEQQRVAVVLAHGYGLTHAETAELMGIARSSVQNHVERGLERLRRALEVTA